ncbi:recombinase family protein [Brevundimonas sp. TWP2-3-4b2]|uniref:recombinase family protein n=1 Tax=Brevundimonas sp. TWP2-3-4b2 TaxID=2804595 RepID=UPI003CF908CE
MPNALGYLRFSTPKQERGDSLERQQTDIRAYCDRKGWPVVEWISDKGRSAYKGDHLLGGNLGKLTKRIEAGEFAPGTVLVVEKLDRLSRQGHRLARRWLEKVIECGMVVAVSTHDKQYDDASLDSMLDAIEVWMAAKLAMDESAEKGRRVGAAWHRKLTEKAERGEVMTARCPGWLTPVEIGQGDQGTSFRIVTERAAVIRSVYEWTAAGDGIARIAKRLAGTAKPWGDTGGNGFTPTHIMRWIDGPQPEGDMIPYFANRKKENGKRVVGYYPRIVDADLVSRARAGRMGRRKTGGRRYINAYGNLFMGVMRCSRCSGVVTMQRGPSSAKNKHAGPGYLHCANASLGRGCDSGVMYRYLDFEKAALAEILHLALDDSFFQKPGETLAANIALAEARKAVEVVRERLDNITTTMSLVKDPAPLIEKYDRLVDELTLAQAGVVDADEALILAKGQIGPNGHLQRVLSVKDAMSSDDFDTCLDARQKVHEAIKGVVEMVVCDPEDHFGAEENANRPQKTLTMILVGGALSFKFSNRGELLGRAGVMSQLKSGVPGMREGVLSVATRAAGNLDALIARSEN